METLQVCVNGKSVKQYRVLTSNYIEAREGTEYSLKIHNNSGNKRLAVVTVDGVNVVSGNVQGSEIGQGYIIQPFSVLDIKGFRKDLDTVGAFKFCKKGQSYCNTKEGLTGNNGVIGVRMYDEKRPVITYRSYPSTLPFWTPAHPDWTVTSSHDEPNTTVDSSSTSYTASTSDRNEYVKSSNCFRGVDNVVQSSLASSKAPDFDLGTTWGKKIDDSVKLVEFENESFASEEYLVYYDSRENLEAIGVVFKEEKHVSKFPKAFGGFATPPKGWK